MADPPVLAAAVAVRYGSAMAPLAGEFVGAPEPGDLISSKIFRFSGMYYLLHKWGSRGQIYINVGIDFAERFVESMIGRCGCRGLIEALAQCSDGSIQRSRSRRRCDLFVPRTTPGFASEGHAPLAGAVPFARALSDPRACPRFAVSMPRPCTALSSSAAPDDVDAGQVLGKPEDLAGIHIVWEHDGVQYQYKVEGSEDGKSWTMLSDQTKSAEREQDRTHKFLARSVRYVRVTATGLERAPGPSSRCKCTGQAKLCRRRRRRPYAGSSVRAGQKCPFRSDHGQRAHQRPIIGFDSLNLNLLASRVVLTFVRVYRCKMHPR